MNQHPSQKGTVICQKSLSPAPARPDPPANTWPARLIRYLGEWLRPRPQGGQ